MKLTTTQRKREPVTRRRKLRNRSIVTLLTKNLFGKLMKEETPTTMKISPIPLLLVLPYAARSQSCDLFNDPCPFDFDLECDDPTGLDFCPSNSDCFDCDPFQQFRNQGCNACIANGGRYCETANGIPVCSAPDIAALAPNACFGDGGTAYMSTCSGAGPSPPTGSNCDIFDDPCLFSFDLECDDPTGLDFCPSNSDCFDCDPLQVFRDQGCDACIANGGRYCETVDGTPVCSSPEIASSFPTGCSGDGGGTPYMSTCSGSGSPSKFGLASSVVVAVLSVGFLAVSN